MVLLCIVYYSIYAVKVKNFYHFFMDLLQKIYKKQKRRTIVK